MHTLPIVVFLAVVIFLVIIAPLFENVGNFMIKIWKRVTKPSPRKNKRR